MSMTTTKFDETMMAMDVIETARHERSLLDMELSAPARRGQMMDKLRSIYAAQGLDVPDEVLAQGVDALEERRYVHKPLKPGLTRALATLYVRRNRLFAGTAVIVACLGLGYVTVRALDEMATGRAEQAAMEEQARQVMQQAEYGADVQRALLLARDRPDLRARLSALQNSYSDSDRQEVRDILTNLEAESVRAALIAGADEALAESATIEADANARAALNEVDARLRTSAQNANSVAYNTALRDRQSLVDRIVTPMTLRIVDREGENSGIWRSRDNGNTRFHYLVVEAERPNGQASYMPIRNAETGVTELVQTFAIRVPASVYEAVGRDKTEDGIVDDRDVGLKPSGSIDIDWTVDTDGATITNWN